MKTDTTGTLRIMAVTDPGCEEACAAEMTRILSRDATAVVRRQQIVETVGTWMDAATLAYRTQTALRVLVAIAPTAPDLGALVTTAPDRTVLDAALAPGGTFKAECEHFDPSLLPQELTEGIGEWVHDAGYPVNLSRPDLVVVAVATPDGIDVGIDMVGAALAKRDWRVMLSSRSIKATIAASAAIYTQLEERHQVLDPFGDDGSLAIEATMLLSGASPRKLGRVFACARFPAIDARAWQQRKEQIDARVRDETGVIVFSDTLRDMKAVRTNAKLAGVDKMMRSTRVSVDWVEAKIEEGSIDRILTAPITSGKVIGPDRVAKLADQLFWQATFVLKKNGTMTCLTEKPEELVAAAAEHGFTLRERRDVRMGQRALVVVTYARAKGKG